MNIDVPDHPGLRLCHLAVTLPRPLGALPSPDWLTVLLRPDAVAPLAPPDGLPARVRDLLRGHGYRPTGRGKPSSEYLAAAAAAGRLGPINAVVDAGNAASLHSGLPISIVDLDRCTGQLRVAIPPAGSRYAQRTKTGDGTVRVLAVVWGTAAPAGHAEATARWLEQLLARVAAG